MDLKLLEEIGLTEGETKVYLALLRLGSTKTGALAKEAGVSPTLIQNMRSGKSSNISLNTLAPILSALQYRIEFVKDNTI